jgi:uncharacterized lipoprotein NlpE involved in copper resistance
VGGTGDVICNKSIMFSKLAALLLTLTLIGCNQQETVDIVLTDYPYDKAHAPVNLVLEIDRKQDRINYLYGFSTDSGTTHHHAVTMFADTDSVILYIGDTARFVDQKLYGSELIKKYYYNLEKVYDEELYLFTLEGVGLVGYVEFAWDGYGLFDHPLTDVEQKLKEDDSGFFYKRRK